MSKTTLIGKYKVTIEEIIEELEETAGKTKDTPRQRYAEGSRANPVDWRETHILRTAIAIGYAAFAFYVGSCVKRPGQTSERQLAYRADSEREFRRRVIKYVHMVYPELTRAYGHSADGGTTDTEQQSISKRISNAALYAEFESTFEDNPVRTMIMYSQAIRLVAMTQAQLRKAGIQPVTANGDLRKPKTSAGNVV